MSQSGDNSTCDAKEKSQLEISVVQISKYTHSAAKLAVVY